jgi:hypothetical protein
MHVEQWHKKSCYGIGIGLRSRKDGRQCLLLFNAEAQATVFALPEGSWSLVLDTSDPQLSPYQPKEKIDIPPYSVMMVLQEAAQQSPVKIQAARQA